MPEMQASEDDKRHHRIFCEWRLGGYISTLDSDFHRVFPAMVEKLGAPDVVEFRAGDEGWSTSKGDDRMFDDGEVEDEMTETDFLAALHGWRFKHRSTMWLTKEWQVTVCRYDKYGNADITIEAASQVLTAARRKALKLAEECGLADDMIRGGT